jgi:hypothetical protein
MFPLLHLKVHFVIKFITLLDKLPFLNVSDLNDPLMGIEMDDSDEDESDDSMSDISDSEIAPSTLQQQQILTNHQMGILP